MDELFPYQKEGAAWLTTKAQALLADEMGLGKSAQAIRAADLVGAKSILVICPGSLRINWSREFWRFSPLDRSIQIITTGKDRLNGSEVSICSYDLLVAPNSDKSVDRAEEAEAYTKRCWAYATALQGDHGPASAAEEARRAEKASATARKRAVALAQNEKDRDNLLRQLKTTAWNLVILDEAHYLKERAADRTRAIYGRSRTQPGLTSKAERVWRLTGTPAPNNASELWTHLRWGGAVNEPFQDFAFKFCIYDESMSKVLRHKNVKELKALLAPFMLRRTKEEVMKDLPPLHWQHLTVERGAVDLSLFKAEIDKAGGQGQFVTNLKVQDQTLKAALEAIGPSSGAQGTADKLSLLNAMANNMPTLRRYVALSKVRAILSILTEELEDGAIDKMVIFAHHTGVIDAAKQALKQFNPVTVVGSDSMGQRQKAVDRFQNDTNCRVFLGNLVAAGSGITLTASCEVVFLEQSWVPAENAQAAMRCHRIGQTRPVRVRVFSLADSVDEVVQDTLVRKARELSKIF